MLYFALSNTLPFPGKSLKKVLELTAKCKVRYDPTLFGESWLHNMNVNPNIFLKLLGCFFRELPIQYQLVMWVDQVTLVCVVSYFKAI